MLRAWTTLWIIISLFLGYEYFALNTDPRMGFLFLLQSKGILSAAVPLNPAPGRPISLWLGWTGFSLMVLTNLYVLRKRVSWMSNWGNLGRWLDFHIFCGLVGPTFIFFHCNFKVGGLVGISFWSMVISFLSGIVGRYFYVNMLLKKKDCAAAAELYWNKFLKLAKEAGLTADSKEIQATRALALQYVGFTPASSGPLQVLRASLMGDLRCLMAPPESLPALSPRSAYLLEAFAVQERKAEAIVPFQKLMGYWHTFHTPFAVFMYVVAIIHIISALFFGV